VPITLELIKKGLDLGVNDTFVNMDRLTFNKLKTAIEMIDEYWDTEVKNEPTRDD
jgi:hypothetical protein